MGREGLDVDVARELSPLASAVERIERQRCRAGKTGAGPVLSCNDRAPEVKGLLDGLLCHEGEDGGI